MQQRNQIIHQRQLTLRAHLLTQPQRSHQIAKPLPIKNHPPQNTLYKRLQRFRLQIMLSRILHQLASTFFRYLVLLVRELVGTQEGEDDGKGEEDGDAVPGELGEGFVGDRS